MCVCASFKAQTHNIVACYPSQLADRASGKECFQVEKPKKAFSQLPSLQGVNEAPWRMWFCVSMCVPVCECVVSVFTAKQRSVSMDWPIHWTIINNRGSLLQAVPSHFLLKHPLPSPPFTSQNLLRALNRQCLPVHLLVFDGGLPLGITLEEKVAAWCS